MRTTAFWEAYLFRLFHETFLKVTRTLLMLPSLASSEWEWRLVLTIMVWLMSVLPRDYYCVLVIPSDSSSREEQGLFQFCCSSGEYYSV